MKFSQLTFIVTDDCNYHCDYCPQIKEKNEMETSTVERAAAFFYPYLEEKAWIVFYGGEPLLSVDTIKYAVSLLKGMDEERGKKLNFSITTNGSLITDEILELFDRNSFDVMLSFDGFFGDMGAKGDRFFPVLELARNIQNKTYPNIRFSTNSVFTPTTVRHLSESLQAMIETGITGIQFALAENMPWDDTSLEVLEDELRKLSEFLVSYYKEKGTFPVDFFSRVTPRPKRDSSFTCAAAARRMAITPGENVWGCPVFHDYFKNRKDSPEFETYSFGMLDDFERNYETVYPGVLLNYTRLRQEFFFTENRNCFFCAEVKSCRVCPVSAAYASSTIGKISPWVCRLNKIQKEAKGSFLQEIQK